MELDRAELESRLFEGFAKTSKRRYIYLCNMKTGVSRWSKNAVDDFGLPGEYMYDAGHIWAEYVHPDDREAYLRDIEDVFAGKKYRHDMDYRALNKEGEYVLCTCRGCVMQGSEDEPDLFIGTIENHSITDNIDSTTNLYNIYEFWRYLSDLKRNRIEAIILFVGVNNFSEVNATYGYEFGDKVLREVGSRIRQVIRERGKVYRLDGVQFACCFTDCDSEDIREIYAAIQEEVRNNIYISGNRMSVSVSGGTVVYDENYDEHSVQTSAKYALGQSKHKYHGELVFFDSNLMSGNRKSLELMNSIRNCILNHFDGFYLVYQPIVDAKTEMLVGAEALLRWKKDDMEVPPGLFLPWLENDPCFWDLGNWILRQAISEVRPLIDLYPDFVLNINLAYPQMSHVGFCETVVGIVEDSGFPKEHICFELTERCHQLEMGYLKDIIVRLKAKGIKIAIDDFGIGFSSLNLLSALPINILKIDKDFIRDIKTNATNQAIVEALASCAKKLDVQVCLEGIEDRELIEFVKQYEIHSYQGYYFSKPITIEKFRDKYL